MASQEKNKYKMYKWGKKYNILTYLTSNSTLCKLIPNSHTGTSQHNTKKLNLTQCTDQQMHSEKLTEIQNLKGEYQ